MPVGYVNVDKKIASTRIHRPTPYCIIMTLYGECTKMDLSECDIYIYDNYIAGKFQCDAAFSSYQTFG